MMMKMVMIAMILDGDHEDDDVHGDGCYHGNGGKIITLGNTCTSIFKGISCTLGETNLYHFCHKINLCWLIVNIFPLLKIVLVWLILNNFPVAANLSTKCNLFSPAAPSCKSLIIKRNLQNLNCTIPNSTF